MKLTQAFLDKWDACISGREYAKSAGIIGLRIGLAADNLIKNSHLDWANWMVSHALSRGKRIEYACFAAEQVLPLFEEKFPNDKRLRDAITAARKCIKDKSAEAAKAARAAARAAEAAARAAWAAGAAWAAARAAAWAALAAGAAEAAEAAEAAAEAAARAARAAWAAGAAGAGQLIAILDYGLSLLKEPRP